MLKTIGRYVEDRIKLATAPLLKRIDELEKRGVEYQGVYQRAQSYRRGSLITHDGSVWACIEDAQVNESPGSHPSKWQLAVRAGRDGRDANRLPTKSGARPTTIVDRRT